MISQPVKGPEKSTLNNRTFQRSKFFTSDCLKTSLRWVD